MPTKLIQVQQPCATHCQFIFVIFVMYFTTAKWFQFAFNIILIDDKGIGLENKRKEIIFVCDLMMVVGSKWTRRYSVLKRLMVVKIVIHPHL